MSNACLVSLAAIPLTRPIATLNTDLSRSAQQQSTKRTSYSKTRSEPSASKSSTGQVLEGQQRTQKVSQSEVQNINLRRTSDQLRIDQRRWEADAIHSTSDCSVHSRTGSESTLPDSVKQWAQEQGEKARRLMRQVLKGYQQTMNNIVDQLYTPSDDVVPFIQGNFAPVPEIGEKVRIKIVEGQVPKDFPPGCYIRNGPNPRFGQNLNSPLLGGTTLYSWFEGEGMLHATYFQKDGSVWYKNKYVETESFKIETEMGRRIYLPTMDERSCPGARFNRMFNFIRYGQPQRNPGNTSVFEHTSAGHVVAVSEGGKAFEIDISDLSTKGEYNCNGLWNRRFFGPHPKIHPDTNQIMVYGFDIINPYYGISIFSDDGEQLLNTIDLHMDRLVLMHDIGITEGHIIVYDFPVVMDIFNMLLKGEPLLSVDLKTYSRIGVIPLMGDEKSVVWFDVDTACLSHHCNSYQDGDEIVVHGLVTCNLQLVSAPREVDYLDWYSKGMTLEHQFESECEIEDPCGLLYEHLHEWRLNLKTGAVTEERNISQNNFPLELPRINEKFTGKKYRYIYAASEDIEASKARGYPMFGSLVKVDISQGTEQLVQFHDMGENTFASEPVFVARPGATEEDDGWIVTYVHNESTNISDMVIIDAQNFEKEPLARIRLPQRVPYGFHGAYVQGL